MAVAPVRLADVEPLWRAASLPAVLALTLAMTEAVALVRRWPEHTSRGACSLTGARGRLARRPGIPRRSCQRARAGSLGAAGLSLTLLLVLGLMTFPTTCRCGADLPHQHGLFELPGHHHGDAAPLVGYGTSGNHDLERPVVRAPEGSGANTQVSAATVQSLSYPPVRWPQRSPLSSSLVPDGRSVVPDPPPPRA
jgi:hypothetical protein